MAKKRKTRQQKKLADLRHNIQHQTIDYTFEVKPSSTKIEDKPSAQSTVAYPYLVKDLTKTITLSGLIIGAQIFLFLLLKFNTIKIFGLSY